MTASSSAPRTWQRIIRKIVALKPITRFFAQFVHRVDGFAMQHSGNHFSATAALTGWPVAMITMTGAKTGTQRSLPLVCIHDGDKRVLIASNLGSQKNPGWYYNLLANPHVQLSGKNEQGYYTARQASPGERKKYWKEALQLYPGYADYQERTGSRIIPIMVLEPDIQAE